MSDYTPTGNPATDADGVSDVIRAEFGLIQTAITSKADTTDIGTTIQAYDATLTSIAALGTAADKISYTTGADTWAETSLTTAARTVLDDTTVEAMVDTLGGAASSGTGGLSRLNNPAFGPITATTINGAFISRGLAATSSNLGIGNSAAGSTTTGTYVIGVGQGAAQSVTTGVNITAIGGLSVSSNVTGSNITGVGYQALSSATSGDLTAVGYRSGYLITTGTKHSIFGPYSGNQGGLDITTASGYIVLADGDGNPKIYHNGTKAFISGGLDALGTPTSGTLTHCTGIPTAGLVDAAVTLAKMANLAQDQVIGRTTASTGVPETFTVTAASRTYLDDATVADAVNTLGGATSTGTGGLMRSVSPTVSTGLGVGTAPLADRGIAIGGSGLVGVTQYGVVASFTASSGATTAAYGQAARVTTADAAFTCPDVAGFYALNHLRGASSTLQNAHGVLIADQTNGTNNYGITSAVSSGANKRNLNITGTADNVLAGKLRVGGTTAPTAEVDVTGAIAASTTLKTGSYTVATLPTPSDGLRAFVTDALAPTSLSGVVGGGAVHVPVYYSSGDASWHVE
jgi:hypothetical protein